MNFNSRKLWTIVVVIAKGLLLVATLCLLTFVVLYTGNVSINPINSALVILTLLATSARRELFWLMCLPIIALHSGYFILMENFEGGGRYFLLDKEAIVELLSIIPIDYYLLFIFAFLATLLLRALAKNLNSYRVVANFKSSALLAVALILFSAYIFMNKDAYLISGSESTVPLVYLLIDKDKANDTVNAMRADKSRFIAHAGGAIDGNRYTNSLEALNASYQQGYRLFELDILETLDGYYVAAHSWQDWQSHTGYQGELPPMLEEFKKHKILGKYTPLDMQAINEWFGLHTDAVFVSDKVNKPRKFATQFIDPSRLRMEIFSWEALAEAQEIGLINPMVTLNLINALPKNVDKINHLQKRGVKYVVANRNMNKVLAVKMKMAGIKIYAYITNNRNREIKTLCNEHHFFYGLYADNFDFEQVIDCRQYFK